MAAARTCHRHVRRGWRLPSLVTLLSHRIGHRSSQIPASDMVAATAVYAPDQPRLRIVFRSSSQAERHDPPAYVARRRQRRRRRQRSPRSRPRRSSSTDPVIELVWRTGMAPHLSWRQHAAPAASLHIGGPPGRLPVGPGGGEASGGLGVSWRLLLPAADERISAGRGPASDQTRHFFGSCFGLRHTHHHQRKHRHLRLVTASSTTP